MLWDFRLFLYVSDSIPFSYVFYKVWAQPVSALNFFNSHVHEAEIVMDVLVRCFYSLDETFGVIPKKSHH